MALSIETASELAIVAARAEWCAMNAAGEIDLPQEFIREFVWGWIFESAIVGAENDRYAGISVSVDRFSGKTSIIDGCIIANDDWPLLELTLKEIGPNRHSVFQFVRELRGWNATEAVQELRSLPLVVAVGPMISIRPISEALIARGAMTSISRKRAM